MPAGEGKLSTRASLFIDYTIGMSDGLMISFVLITGLSVSFGNSTILKIVLAAIFLGALAMGLSRYFSTPLDNDRHHDHPSDTPDPEQAKLSEQWEEDALLLAEGHTSKISALNIAFSYMAGGLLPLLPFWIFTTVRTAYAWSLGFTLAMLLVLGFTKAKFTGTRPFPGILRALLLCGCAAGAAYLIARLFV